MSDEDRNSQSNDGIPEQLGQAIGDAKNVATNLLEDGLNVASDVTLQAAGALKHEVDVTKNLVQESCRLSFHSLPDHCSSLISLSNFFFVFET